MASTTKSRATDSRVDLLDVSWAGFKRMLKVRGDRRSPRIWYLDRSLSLVSPSVPHEEFSERFGTFVIEVALGLELPCRALGSVTLMRKGESAAVEGDKTFYLGNAERIRGKEELDLDIDPPPDLAIEVVITHGAKKAMEIYRRLGVPEVWVCSRKRLRFFGLSESGAYVESETSRAFATLRAAEVFDWINRSSSELTTEWLVRLRSWVRDELAPRANVEGRRDGE